MPFSALLNQEVAIAAFRSALSQDKLAATYLLVGPEGVGKGALARAVAEAACCSSPVVQPFDACGVCESCRRAVTEAHPDIVIIAPAGDQLQIGQFWDRDNRSEPGALSRTLNYAPTVGRRRVYLIERADTLTPQAANSLLKVLEEPPPYVLFLLLATHSARMLPTILSRSQMVRVTPAPVAQLARYLSTKFGLSSADAETIAFYSEARTGLAVRYANSPAALAESAAIVDLGESLAVAHIGRALRDGELIRKQAGQTTALASIASQKSPQADDSEAGGQKERVSRRQVAIVLDTLLVFYRDLLALSVNPHDHSIVNRSRTGKLQALAAMGPPERWASCLDSLVKARRRLDANANIPLLTDILAMELTREG